jgi:hypothetical protein
MRDPITIRSIRFTQAPPELLGTGLLGWVALRYGDMELADISVRQTLEGRRVLSFPETRRRSGRVQQPVRPASQDVRAQIEAYVFAELRLMGVIP